MKKVNIKKLNSKNLAKAVQVLGPEKDDVSHSDIIKVLKRLAALEATVLEACFLELANYKAPSDILRALGHEMRKGLKR